MNGCTRCAASHYCESQKVMAIFSKVVAVALIALAILAVIGACRGGPLSVVTRALTNQGVALCLTAGALLFFLPTLLKPLYQRSDAPPSYPPPVMPSMQLPNGGFHPDEKKKVTFAESEIPAAVLAASVNEHNRNVTEVQSLVESGGESYVNVLGVPMVHTTTEGESDSSSVHSFDRP